MKAAEFKSGLPALPRPSLNVEQIPLPEPIKLIP